MVGTFWGQKSLKALSNKVFRFIQPALGTGKSIKEICSRQTAIIGDLA
jgi:hypothetical protein